MRGKRGKQQKKKNSKEEEGEEETMSEQMKEEQEERQEEDMQEEGEEEEESRPSKKKQRLSSSSKTNKKNEPLRIIVVHRGDITEKIYETWQQELPQHVSHEPFDITFSNQYNNEDHCIIIISPSLTADSFEEWLDGKSLKNKKNVHVLSSDWIIDAIQYNGIPRNYEDYLMNPLTPHEVNMIAKGQEENEEYHYEERQQIKEEQEEGGGGGESSRGSRLDEENANKFITDLLEELEMFYEMIGEQFRSLAYKRAIALLKQMPKITSIHQVTNVKGIGKSIASKIQQILETGYLEKLKEFEKNPFFHKMMELTQIWGIGEKKAMQLIKQGFDSVKKLNDHIDDPSLPLTAQQKVGLKYYDELLVPIPRDEVETIHDIVRHAASNIFSGFSSYICGSYRRGHPTSRDVDILIIPAASEGEGGGDDESYRSDSMLKLVTSLIDEGFLIDHLTLPRELTALMEGESEREAVDTSDRQVESAIQVTEKHAQMTTDRLSYQGIGKLTRGGKNHHHARRIDINIYPRSQFPFAYLYFTGSNIFNRSMRLYAKRQGYLLNDKQLLYEGEIPRRPTYHPRKGQSIECNNEREIFEALDLPYREPSEREAFEMPEPKKNGGHGESSTKSEPQMGDVKRREQMQASAESSAVEP